MNDEGKKVGKKILTIAGAVAGTCVISAGTFLLADSGLAFVNTKIEKTNETEKMSELNSSKDMNAETELIAKSKDSFIIKEQKESNSEANKDSTDNNQSQGGTSGEGTNNAGTDGSGTGNSGTNNNQGTSQGGTNTGGGSTGGTGSSDTGNNGYVDNGTGDYSGGNTGYDEGSSGNTGGSGEDGGSDTVTPVDPPQTEAPAPPQTEAPAPPQTEAPVPPQTEAPVPPEPEPPQTEAPEPGWDDTFIFSDSNERYISESELESMSMEDVAIARNEIFARNGRIFSTKKWAEYFSTKSWYVPQYDQAAFDSMDLLNAYEKANLKVILAYEEKIG